MMTAQQYVDVLKANFKTKEMMLGKVVEIELAAQEHGGGMNGMNRPQTHALIHEMRRLIHEQVAAESPAESNPILDMFGIDPKTTRSTQSHTPQVGEGREDWADMDIPNPTEDDIREREQRYNAAVRRNEPSGRRPRRR